MAFLNKRCSTLELDIPYVSLLTYVIHNEEGVSIESFSGGLGILIVSLTYLYLLHRYINWIGYFLLHPTVWQNLNANVVY